MGKACGMHRTVEKRIQISDEKDHWGGGNAYMER